MALHRLGAAEVSLFSANSAHAATTRRPTSVVLVVVACITVIAHSAVALEITLLTSGANRAIVQPLASGSGTPLHRVNAYIDGLGEGESGLASSGPSTASGTWDLSTSGFLITGSFSRDPAGGLAQVAGNVWFSVDEPIDYVMAGMLVTTDPIGGEVEFQGYLRESPDARGPMQYSSRQISRTTPNEGFTLGETGGDFSNSLTGSPSGTLAPGLWYQMWFFARMETRTTSTVPASGTANISLMFVPEPSTALLVGFGLIGMAAVKRHAVHRHR